MLEVVGFIMEHRTWEPSCLRLNIARLDDIVIGKTGFKRAAIQSELVGNKTMQDRFLKIALSKVAPEWDGARTCITNDKNLVCLPHKDPNNADYSYICFLGDYDSGELLFEDGTVISERYAWHKFDGPHN